MLYDRSRLLRLASFTFALVLLACLTVPCAFATGLTDESGLMLDVSRGWPGDYDLADALPFYVSDKNSSHFCFEIVSGRGAPRFPYIEITGPIVVRANVHYLQGGDYDAVIPSVAGYPFGLMCLINQYDENGKQVGWVKKTVNIVALSFVGEGDIPFIFDDVYIYPAAKTVSIQFYLGGINENPSAYDVKDIVSAFGYYLDFDLSLSGCSYKGAAVFPGDETEFPTDPSEPGGSTLPTSPGSDSDSPSLTIPSVIWLQKLDSMAFPDFPLGDGSYTLNVKAQSSGSGYVEYKWRLTGQDGYGHSIMDPVETGWQQNLTSYDIPLDIEGLYSVSCQARIVYSDDNGNQFTTLPQLTSLTYSVSSDGSDLPPEPISPPYEGWQEDMEQADELNNNIQNNVDDIEGGLEVLDSVTMPNIDNIDLNIYDLIDHNGFSAMNTILGVLWDNNIVMVSMTIAFVLAMVGYFVFGKR